MFTDSLKKLQDEDWAYSSIGRVFAQHAWSSVIDSQYLVNQVQCTKYGGKRIRSLKSFVSKY